MLRLGMGVGRLKQGVGLKCCVGHGLLFEAMGVATMLSRTSELGIGHFFAGFCR